MLCFKNGLELIDFLTADGAKRSAVLSCVRKKTLVLATCSPICRQSSTATHYSALQQTAPHCGTPRHNATYYYTLHCTLTLFSLRLAGNNQLASYVYIHIYIYIYIYIYTYMYIYIFIYIYTHTHTHTHTQTHTQTHAHTHTHTHTCLYINSC